MAIGHLTGHLFSQDTQIQYNFNDWKTNYSFTHTDSNLLLNLGNSPNSSKKNK